MQPRIVGERRREGKVSRGEGKMLRVRGRAGGLGFHTSVAS